MHLHCSTASRNIVHSSSEFATYLFTASEFAAYQRHQCSAWCELSGLNHYAEDNKVNIVCRGFRSNMGFSTNAVAFSDFLQWPFDFDGIYGGGIEERSDFCTAIKKFRYVHPHPQRPAAAARLQTCIFLLNCRIRKVAKVLM
jgi:hypothetical protein